MMEGVEGLVLIESTIPSDHTQKMRLTSAVFTVKVPDDLNIKKQTIHVYYGNSDATMTSKGRQYVSARPHTRSLVSMITRVRTILSSGRKSRLWR